MVNVHPDPEDKNIDSDLEEDPLDMMKLGHDECPEYFEASLQCINQSIMLYQIIVSSLPWKV